MAALYYWIICLSAAFSLGIAVDICGNGTETRRNVILQRRNSNSNINNNRADCRCILQLTGNTGTTVTFSTTDGPFGCQYKLVFDFKQNRSTEDYHCRRYVIPNKFLYPGYNYTVVLEKHDNNNSGFEFSLEISTASNNTEITISCSTSDKPILPYNNITNPITSDKPTTIVSKTTIDQTKSTTDHNTSTTYHNTPTTDHNTSTTDHNTSTTDHNTSTTDHNTPTTDHNTPTTDQAGNGQTTKNDIDEESDSLAVIIGCSVSGVVLISIVIITVVVCFLKRRKEKTLNDQRFSEQNISGGPIYSVCHEDVSNLTTQNENKDTGYAVAFSPSIDNDLNDLDDYDHLPEPNHVPAHPNHVPAQPNHVPRQLKDVPDTGDEYAVVDKKPKKGSNESNIIDLNNKSKKVKVNEDYENIPKDKLNLKREIDRIVGPKGDDYTLVNKC